MFFRAQVESHLDNALMSASDLERAHLSVIQQMMSGRVNVVAAVKPLNRYSVQPGKTFATSPTDKNKYKVLRVIADDVVVQDLASKKVQTFQVDRLLKDWADRGVKEVSLLEDIVQTVRTVLGPVLGIFLTSALIAWLAQQIGK